MNKNILDRRALIKGSLAGAAIAAASGKVFAAPSGLSDHDQMLVKRAKKEMERVGPRLWARDKVGMVDYSLHSGKPRLFIVDMMAGKVRPYFCAHGRGSDTEHDGYLNDFSNVPGSLATSRGAYLSMEWYKGKYGMSMRLGGLDRDNDQAFDRAIVVHEAWYAAPDMVSKWGKLGRSEGCFAVPPGQCKEMLYHLGGGKLLFADKL